MRADRRRFLGIVAASLGVAGCLGGPGGGSSPTQADRTVGVSSHPEFGEILVGPDGMTLYLFEQDTRGAGESVCTGGCADAWPPLTAEDEPSAGDGVSAELSTLDRGDGTRQVAANGWPLYYYRSDESVGDVKGQGVNDVWWVLDAGGSPVKAAQPSTGTKTDAGPY